MEGIRVHHSADVAEGASIGAGTSIWNEAQVRDGARVGSECILGKGVFVDVDVVVGDRVKLENRVSLFKGAHLENGVFVGPHSCFLNDKRPRAINPDGTLKSEADWLVSGVYAAEGAAVGGGCTVLPGVRIGRYAMIGAGSVVVRSVPDYGLVVGNPARLIGYVCECGARLEASGVCGACQRAHDLPTDSAAS